MFSWRDPGMLVAGRATLCDTRPMNQLTFAQAVVSSADARRFAKSWSGRIIVSPVTTHLLARRALVPWWEL